MIEMSKELELGLSSQTTQTIDPNKKETTFLAFFAKISTTKRRARNFCGRTRSWLLMFFSHFFLNFRRSTCHCQTSSHINHYGTNPFAANVRTSERTRKKTFRNFFPLFFFFFSFSRIRQNFWFTQWDELGPDIRYNCSISLPLSPTPRQCDQIGRYIGLWATFQSLLSYILRQFF